MEEKWQDRQLSLTEHRYKPFDLKPTGASLEVHGDDFCAKEFESQRLFIWLIRYLEGYFTVRKQGYIL